MKTTHVSVTYCFKAGDVEAVKQLGKFFMWDVEDHLVLRDPFVNFYEESGKMEVGFEFDCLAATEHEKELEAATYAEQIIAHACRHAEVEPSVLTKPEIKVSDA